MSSNESAIVATPAASHAEADIVRRFLAWAQRADAGERAEAASALARAFLYSDLSPALRAEATIGMTALLDDPSALVRRALAEALASASEAPRHIVATLACDQSDVAAVVLARSPVLTDAELVDCAAIGDAPAQVALARRPSLSVAVSAALAEIGERDAVLTLVGNLGANAPHSALWRIFERFGADAEIREALLARPSLPAALRAELVEATARSLAEYVSMTGWLAPQRAEKIAREAREQAIATIAAASSQDERASLVRSLRARGALTVALLFRGLLSGDRTLFSQALAELANQPQARVAGFVRDPHGHGFAATYVKAGLPKPYLPAFRAALGAIEELRVGPAERLSHDLVERTIACCESRNDPSLAKLLSLLWRFAGEAARSKAREFAVEAINRPAAPFLIESAQPPLAATPVEGDAPLLDGVLQSAEGELAPRVELSVDLIAALDEAA